MKFLLDVNALLAWAYEKHVHHRRVTLWLENIKESGAALRLVTCAITELGFVRVASYNGRFTASVSTARFDLRKLRCEGAFALLADDVRGDDLPEWVLKSHQTTDGHLTLLAARHGARLATLDTGIPGAELIPELETGWTVREPVLPYTVAA